MNAYGDEYYCPHTTNPFQVKSCCNRCILLEILNINIYKMPQGDWGCSVLGFISDGFKSRQAAEQWVINKHFNEIKALGYKPSNYQFIKEI